MEIRGTTRLIALFGDPVAHSLSPAMHNAAFAKHGLDFAYVPLRVRPADLASAVEALRRFDFLGANVTLPHKQAVLPLLDEVSEISTTLGAVNTIVNRNGKLLGTTTDPEGFLAGFREAGHSFAGHSVAILGAGGSARTLAYALLLTDSPARVLILARDPQKARRLSEEIAARLGNGAMGSAAEGLARKIESAGLADYSLHKDGIDVVVNATPVGMGPDAESSPLNPDDLVAGQVVYDIVYVPERTRLLREARARGLETVEGLGMLVHQGAAAFRLWTGLAPDPELLFQAARAQLRAPTPAPSSPDSRGTGKN